MGFHRDVPGNQGQSRPCPITRASLQRYPGSSSPFSPSGPPREEEAIETRRGGDQKRILAWVAIRSEARPASPARDGPQDDPPREPPPREVSPASRPEKKPVISLGGAAEVDQDSQQGPGVGGDVESKPLVRPTEEVRHQDQMA